MNMHIEQVFWDNYPDTSMTSIDPTRSGSSMIRTGDEIHCRFYDYDHEDRRGCAYSGRFSVADYRKALAELQSHGHSEFEGFDCRVKMQRAADGSVKLAVSPGQSYGSPGGAHLSATPTVLTQFEKLRLKE